MRRTIQEVSVKGRLQGFPAYNLGEALIIIKGQFLKIAEIFDECWVPVHTLPDPTSVLEYLQTIDQKPDLFTFAQRVPDSKPRFEFHMELDNMAVIPVSTYEDWFCKQITRSSQKAIRASARKGVIVREDSFNEKYIQGIMSIFNESSIRQGRKYWHYGKSFDAVEEENGTYRERSSYLGAYCDDKMVGYMKIVWDSRAAYIMQLVSKMAFLDKRPNNALLSEAIRLCAERGIGYLTYGPYVYGNKGEDSLTGFKKANGCLRINLPRYYIPLTPKGVLALGLNLHRDPKDLVPRWLRDRLISFRNLWYSNPATSA